MRYLKTKNQYKASNFLFEVDSQRAWSYDWWLFSTRTPSGKLIFNDSFYSQSTCGHQYKAKRVLSQRIGITLRHTTQSLTNPIAALKDEIRGIEWEIKELIDKINKPRSHKRKNEERLEQIQHFLNGIKKIEKFLEEEYNSTKGDAHMIEITPRNGVSERILSGNNSLAVNDSIITY